MKNTTKALAKKVPGLVYLYGSLSTSRLAKRASGQISNYPRGISIALTTRCNSRCIYCPRTQLIESNMLSARDMDFKLFNEIIAKIKSAKKLPITIQLGGLGEPTLYRNLIDSIQLVRDQLPQVKLNIATNGISLTDEIQQVMVDYELDNLQVSINFHSRELYKRYNRVDKFDTAVSNIESLLRLKGNRKPSAQLQILDLPDNREYIQDFRSFWGKRVHPIDSINVRPVNNWGGFLDSTQYNANIKCHDPYPCAQIFNILHISMDGYCYPCCLNVIDTGGDPLCIGNIKEQSIDELYAPDAHVQWVRSVHKRGDFDKIPFCDKCVYFQRGEKLFFRVAGRWI